MGPLEMLTVRFHFGGAFDYDGYSVTYNGAHKEISHIDRDKLSLPELRGYLADHIGFTSEDHVDFHWLFPGGDMNNGLRRLADDKDCMHMAECIIDGGVADLFVEIYKVEEGDIVMRSVYEASDVINEDSKKKSVISCSPRKEQTTKDIEFVKKTYKYPSKGPEQQAGNGHESQGSETEEDDDDASSDDEALASEDDESEDSEYVEGDENTFEDDEEATQFRSAARNQRKNPVHTPTANLTPLLWIVSYVYTTLKQILKALQYVFLRHVYGNMEFPL